MSLVPIIYEHVHRVRINNRTLRDSMNPFGVSEIVFRRYYRLPQQVALDFVEEMIEAGIDTSGEIPIHIQFLLACNFYATGSYQNQAVLYTQVSAMTFSKYLHKISKFISAKMADKYIKFPMTVQERQINAECFRNCHHFPGIFGLIDGTHIGLAKVMKRDEMHYINRKGFHSINTQIICDCDMNIINVNARYPGSSHDSFIWKSSLAYAHMEDEHQRDPNTQLWLLGDSGYPLQPWLMTPVANPQTDVQKHYNRMHSSTRSKVKRVIGVLKNRFQCLAHDQKLRYTHTKASRIINSCAVLHNYLNLKTGNEDIRVIEEQGNNAVNDRGNRQYLNQGKQVRNTLMVQLYENRY